MVRYVLKLLCLKIAYLYKKFIAKNYFLALFIFNINFIKLLFMLIATSKIVVYLYYQAFCWSWMNIFWKKQIVLILGQRRLCWILNPTIHYWNYIWCLNTCSTVFIKKLFPLHSDGWPSLKYYYNMQRLPLELIFAIVSCKNIILCMQLAKLNASNDKAARKLKRYVKKSIEAACMRVSILSSTIDFA